jgi:hypothetical protein
VLTPVDFGSWLACNSADSVVTIINRGTDPFTVTKVRLDDSTGAFSFPNGSASMLGVMGPGDEHSLHVRYTPHGTGSHVAHVILTLEDRDGMAVDMTADLNGVGSELTVAAAINNSLGIEPARPADVPIQLYEALDDARVNALAIKLHYNGAMLRLAATDNADSNYTRGTLTDGWGLVVRRNDAGEAEFVLAAPADTILRGRGVLLNIPLLATTSNEGKSDLCFDVAETGGSCIINIATQCGAIYRLSDTNIDLEASAAAIELSATPTPSVGDVRVRFVAPGTGRAILTLYAADGRRVMTLFDGNAAGEHFATIERAGLAAGIYFCRLEVNGSRRSLPVIFQ